MTIKVKEHPSHKKMNIVVVGHVDHGKSTLIGRLLVDTDSLPKGKLEKIKKDCEMNAKRFEYAFLIDSLKDEWSKGLTIDTARIFFKSKKRHYIILDAPGHIDFLKNMITGAAHAEAAILVIDAHEGIQENSKRHGYMLSMLGIKQLMVVVNKMDLIKYNQKKFDSICNIYTKFLANLDLHNVTFIPISGFMGDNIVSKSTNTLWYTGKTLLEKLDSFKKEPLPIEQPFRMFIQDVYKFTKESSDKRLIVGSIESGSLSVNDAISFLPSHKKGVVKSIGTFPPSNPSITSRQAGHHIAFTLKEEIYIERGELIYKPDDNSVPSTSSKIQVSLFWLGKTTYESESSSKISTQNRNSKDICISHFYSENY